MKIIASPANYNEAMELIKKNIDVLLVGENNFAVRNTYNCDLKTIANIVQNKQNSAIWINVNAFFYEQDLNKLTNYLIELSKLNIDRVMFNDYAVAQINDEYKLNLKLHYDPNTLITSYGQLPFYVDNCFQSMALSNELFLPEVKTILMNKPKELEIALQVHGYSLIMHSRWNLVTNFKDYVEDKDDEYRRNKIIFIREELREYNNIIYEDEHGTHMFTGYELCLIKFLQQFKDMKLDYIYINNIMQDEGYSAKIVDLYQQAIKLINTKNWEQEIEKLWQECALLAKDSQKIASGFIGGIKEIKHYENK